MLWKQSDTVSWEQQYWRTLTRPSIAGPSSPSRVCLSACAAYWSVVPPDHLPATRTGCWRILRDTFEPGQQLWASTWKECPWKCVRGKWTAALCELTSKSLRFNSARKGTTAILFISWVPVTRVTVCVSLHSIIQDYSDFLVIVECCVAPRIPRLSFALSFILWTCV